MPISRIRKATRWIIGILLLIALASCLDLPAISPTPPPTATSSEVNLREIVILRTNDEHGHLLPTESGGFVRGGAGLAMADWLGRGYDPRIEGGKVLLLSGGDNWVGPAISTWFKGEPTIEAMNAMGYAASVIGNHEFDFGQEALRRRQAEARFPYLAANLYREGSEEIADLAQPYVLVEVNGVKVGLIGLALQGTPSVTAASNVAGLTFGDYETALRRWVPIVRQEGAQLILVETHICPAELVLLANKTRDLDIALFEGGHCHQARLTSADGALISTASAYWQDYTITRLVYDVAQGKVITHEQELVDVLYPTSAQRPAPEPTLQAIIDKWQARAELVLGEEIGYTATGLAKHSQQMHNLLVDSWLWAYPSADVAISNVGGFRQELAAGKITIGDIVGVFPFENELYEIEVKGRDILHALRTKGANIVVGGIYRETDGKIFLRDGTPLDPEATYRLLVTDYMYHNDKYPFQGYDPEPYETSILWRQPVIDWVRAQHSSPQQPLEERIDPRPRL